MPDFRFLFDPAPTDLPRCSAVLSARSRDYVVSRYRTTLTVKAVTSGEAYYRTGHGHYRVTPECFLVLNRGQEYSLEIEARWRTETLCPFFQPGLLEHVADCLATAPERQLDEIEPRAPSTEFYERLYPRTGPVAARLASLQAGLRVPTVTRGWLEDQFYALATALVGLRSEAALEVERFPGVRAATRAELYRRLHRGRDFMCSCYALPLSVAQVARVAHLSPFHFQRMFRLAFGCTPMRFLQEQRLSAARRLLLTTDEPVTAVCLAVGAESLGSFSWLFRKRFGASPRSFRAPSPRDRKTQD
jgi:AraC-like DNA-binding protein